MNAIYKFADDTTVKEGEHVPIYINGTEIERVKSIKFLRVMTMDNLPWTSHVNATVKKAQQHLLFLRRLRKFGMSIRSLTNFYRCTIGSMVSGCIMAWYGNCFDQDHKKLQKLVCTAQAITEANLPSMDSIYMAHCRGKLANVIKDPLHLEDSGNLELAARKDGRGRNPHHIEEGFRCELMIPRQTALWGPSLSYWWKHLPHIHSIQASQYSVSFNQIPTPHILLNFSEYRPRVIDDFSYDKPFIPGSL
eukprot:g33062.t1